MWTCSTCWRDANLRRTRLQRDVQACRAQDFIEGWAWYRARDTKLDRDVAIKILPEAFAHDAERLARFTREAKTLASLNHPNIAAIHGFEGSAGVTALVMELVEGHDLSQRIARGAIPIDEVLPIAKQIAEALEGAHEQGIIHRGVLRDHPTRASQGSPTKSEHGVRAAWLRPASTRCQSTGEGIRFLDSHW
jgi:ADP-ribosylglycohydrolase